jgi:hypothetical protein
MDDTPPPTPDQDDLRAAAQAEDLLPEEQEAGSDDPQAQAEAILEDSDARSGETTATPDGLVEHRTSDQATAPVD